MEIFLIRHGLAGQFGDYEQDSVRPLTEEGVKKTRKVAQRLKTLGIQFDALLTSPYARAMETAILLQSIGLIDEIKTVAELQPEGDRAKILALLNDLRSIHQRVAIVGHEPDLSQLASQLIFGQDCDNLTLKKAGILGLTVPIEGEWVGRCQLFWLVPPRLLLD